MQPTKYQIAAAFAAVYILWGSTYLAIRYAIESIPPIMMGGLRFFTAGIVLYLFRRFNNRDEKPTLNQWKSALIVGGFLLLGGNGGVVWAEQFVPSGLTALLIATVPLWIVLIEWISPQTSRPSKGVWFGVILGFMGVWLLLDPGLILKVHSQKLHVGGTIALLSAAFFWSVGSVYSRRADLPRSPFLATSMEMICGATLMLIFSFFKGEWSDFSFSQITTRSLISFIYLFFFGSLIGFTAYIWLLKMVGPQRTSTYAFVNPVIALFLGWIIGGEALTVKTILASLIIVMAVVVITYMYKEA
jgi:drug/metabolite transporter (DMT)-like permease